MNAAPAVAAWWQRVQARLERFDSALARRGAQQAGAQ